MPLLLIGVRENRWHKTEAQPWLDRDDVPADPIGDLRTSGQRLSVWEILPDQSNLERVVRAIAIGRDNPVDNYGYVVFEQDLLGRAGVKPPDVLATGKTLDTGANGWHRDLIELSGNQLVALTRMILTHGVPGTVLKKRLSVIIEAGIVAREIPERIRAKLPKQTGVAKAEHPSR